jgi:hypothetical protein
LCIRPSPPSCFVFIYRSTESNIPKSIVRGRE